MQEIKKVVVIGPESTGKSTLCRQLAAYYNTFWCPEYAREYLLRNGTGYTYDDLLTIAKGQVQLEDVYMEKAHQAGVPVLFVDTDMYVMEVWCRFVFGKCHPFITDKIKVQRCDLYLLCNTDLPWVKDELREYPDIETREKLYKIYKNILSQQQVPWIPIAGNYEQRMETATEAVDELISLPG